MTGQEQFLIDNGAATPAGQPDWTQVATLDGTRALLPSGAILGGHRYFSEFRPPPKDEAGRLKARMKYHRLLAEEFRRAFDAFKRYYVTGQGSWPMRWPEKCGEEPAESDAYEAGQAARLWRIKNFHDRHLSALKALREEFARLPDASADPDWQRDLRERAARREWLRREYGPGGPPSLSPIGGGVAAIVLDSDD